MTNNNRICTRCGASEKDTKFQKTGPYCTKCKTEYTRLWRKNNPEKARETARTYNQKNKERLNKQRNEYYHSHIEKCREKQKQYYENHKEEHKAKCRKNEAKTPHRTWTRKTLHGHKKRGNDIQVTIDQVYELALKTTTCKYCDKILDYSQDGSKKHSPQPNSPALDRITNENILHIKNIQIICHKCNEIKNNMTHDQLVDYCAMITNKFKTRNKIISRPATRDD